MDPAVRLGPLLTVLKAVGRGKVKHVLASRPWGGGGSLSPPVKGAVELSVGEGGSCPQ